MRNIQIYLSDKSLCEERENSEQIEFVQLVRLARSNNILKHVFSYNSLQLYCEEFNDLSVPFLALCLCRILCVGRCEWINRERKVIRITAFLLLRMALLYIGENVTYKGMLKRISKDIQIIERRERLEKELVLENAPLYLRLDLTFGIKAGGSVGHIAGIVNNLSKFCNGTIFVSTDDIPTIDDGIEKCIIRGEIPYRNVTGITPYMGNLVTYPIIENLIKNNKIGFIYQRSGLDIYAGVKAAVEFNLPYVLEYNGSEIWCEENWGNNSIKHIELARRIERVTFEKADLITCVSAPLKEQLIEMGIKPDKIIVNPNGVNPDRYRPDIDGTDVREKYGISKNDIVIGFIGTFGAWHGAELLAKAYAEISQQNKNIHLLMIGDGLKLSEVKNNLKEIETSRYTLTGLIPQEQGPFHLAACDILVNPTIPNADGTPFFGSPTKLFEYMAMGKAIVASGMEQMLEVLEHGKTALLVEPGEVSELVAALNKLIGDEELRCSLGDNARKKVCEQYTWEIHTKKIVDKLAEVMEI